MSVRIICGDMLVELPKLETDSIDACCTDPPYHLTNNTGSRSPNPGRYTPIGKPKTPRGGFMGKQWDGGDVAFRPETWEAVWRVLKPGAHLLAFGGTRTFHRMACAIEDAGFEIRDTIAWMYGSGFPKSLDVSKAIDKAAGAVREVVGQHPTPAANKPGGNSYSMGVTGMPATAVLTAPATPEAARWSGWGTALKPAMELICVARKPLAAKTVAANVLKYGAGALNIDACRIEAAQGDEPMKWETPRGGIWKTDNATTADIAPSPLGRFPANVCHDGSDEVLAAFPVVHGAGAAREEPGAAYPASDNGWGHIGKGQKGFRVGDNGSSARFFKECKWQSNESTNANDVVQTFDLQSEPVVFALSDAVAQTTEPWALLPQSYQGQNTSVSGKLLRTICASVTALIQNLEPRFSPELRPTKRILTNDHVTCVAIPEPTGTTTITVSLWKFDGSVALVTFSIMPQSMEPGALGLASAKRFHYTAKADSSDRQGSKHPTVKPTDLMRWLVKLITPPGGTVIDPFCGTGSTLLAADQLQLNAIGIEQDATYAEDARRKFTRDAGLFASLATQ